MEGPIAIRKEVLVSNVRWESFLASMGGGGRCRNLVMGASKRDSSWGHEMGTAVT